MFPSVQLSALSPRAIRAGALGTWFLCCLACSLGISSKTAEVLTSLGTSAHFNGGDCTEGERLVDVYLKQIGRHPSVSLGTTVPKFAKQAAAICPASRPTITPSNQVAVSMVGTILGVTNLPQDGTIRLETWLELTVAQGKVVSLMVVLSEVPR